MRNYTVYTNGKQIASGRFRPDVKETEMKLVKLYPTCTDQRLGGFGCGITDSSAYVWAQMPQAQKDELIDAFFSEQGLNYSLVRVPIDSCDFSVEEYEACPDGDLSKFDTSRSLRYILPMLEAIRAKKEVSLLLSPWSPPAAFKSNGIRQEGGVCLPEYWQAWAGILCRYVKEFEDLGFHVFGLTLQNEPHATQTWDSCLWTAEEERDFMVGCVRPTLDRAGFEHVGIYVWDHNKERVLDRSLALFTEEGRECAEGVAFHWYSGDHFAVLRKVHELFPEKQLILSEHCIDQIIRAENANGGRDIIAHEIIGDLECGTNRCFDWNILLDEQGGPNYVDNFCHAPYRYDTRTGLLARQEIYDSYWHFAHFLSPGDLRILSSSFSADLETTAFLKKDGTIVLVLLNRGRARAISVALGDQIAPVELSANSLTTVVIEAE